MEAYRCGCYISGNYFNFHFLNFTILNLLESFILRLALYFLSHHKIKHIRRCISHHVSLYNLCIIF